MAQQLNMHHGNCNIKRGGSSNYDRVVGGYGLQLVGIEAGS